MFVLIFMYFKSCSMKTSVFSEYFCFVSAVNVDLAVRFNYLLWMYVRDDYCYKVCRLHIAAINTSALSHNAVILHVICM